MRELSKSCLNLMTLISFAHILYSEWAVEEICGSGGSWPCILLQEDQVMPSEIDIGCARQQSS